LARATGNTGMGTPLRSASCVIMARMLVAAALVGLWAHSARAGEMSEEGLEPFSNICEIAASLLVREHDLVV
jgi:hypothetical protein